MTPIIYIKISCVWGVVVEGWLCVFTRMRILLCFVCFVYIYIYIFKEKTKDRLIFWVFFFKELLLCKKLHWALHQENLNVQLLNHFLVLKELVPTLVLLDRIIPIYIYIYIFFFFFRFAQFENYWIMICDNSDLRKKKTDKILSIY